MRTWVKKRAIAALVAAGLLAACGPSVTLSPSTTSSPVATTRPVPGLEESSTTLTTTGSVLRRGGEVIRWTGDHAYLSGDLVAQDPETGEVRTLVAAESLSYRPQPGEVSVDTSLIIGGAAWSADGIWVAFEILACGGGWSDEAGAGGLWVTNGLDEPRQLTKPCFEEGNVDPHTELWEWSPTGVQLVVARQFVDGDTLMLIDPATGDRTDLGKAAGDVTSLAWSPDGARIAYGAVPAGTGGDYSGAEQGSVYSVRVGGGDHALLASSLGQVSGGETGSGIRWSPDGARIAVLTEVMTEAEANRLYLMDADGSNLDLLIEGVVIAHTLRAPGLAWSPDGTRMAYTTFSGEREKLQVWNASPDGSAPILVFDSGPAPEPVFWLVGGPVWSPDGTAIAFRYSPTSEETTVWLVANADGTGDVRDIDELLYLSWRGGWYFCECYG